MNNAIYPCLWFDGNAKAAADFYCTVFNDTTITADNPMVVKFNAGGQEFMCLNGGPQFKINPSVSFYTVCETEEEINAAWQKLVEGGKVLMAFDKYPWSEKYGWLQDKFGVSWQLSYGKLASVHQKFTPLLMFTGANGNRAEEAIHFYTTVFKNSAIKSILHFEEGEHETKGNVKHAQFIIDDYGMMAIGVSSANEFTFNEAVSMVVNCETQVQIDEYWKKLTADGGEESRCGWCKDKYGVWWQIVPSILEKLMSDPQKAPRVIQAFLQMKKFDIAKLLEA